MHTWDTGTGIIIIHFQHGHIAASFGRAECFMPCRAFAGRFEDYTAVVFPAAFAIFPVFDRVGYVKLISVAYRIA